MDMLELTLAMGMIKPSKKRDCMLAVLHFSGGSGHYNSKYTEHRNRVLMKVIKIKLHAYNITVYWFSMDKVTSRVIKTSK